MALDARDLGRVLPEPGVDVCPARLEVYPVRGIGRDAPPDDLGKVFLLVLRKRAERADVEGQRIGGGDGVQVVLFLEDGSGKRYVDLPQLRCGVDGLNVFVDEVARAGDHNRVETQAFGDDGDLDVAVEHLVLALDLAAVERRGQHTGVVVHSLAFGDSVDGREPLVRDEGGVGLEGIQVGDVPVQEHLQLVLAYEARGVCDDGVDEALVLLVAAQLRPAVVLAGDKHRL